MKNDTHFAALCLTCRGKFTAQQIEGATACPKCGSNSVPADPNELATITLTEHELKILCMWAHNWGKEHATGTNPVDGIVNEIRSQCSALPPLTMDEEFSGIKKAFPTAEMHDGKGNKIGGELN